MPLINNPMEWGYNPYQKDFQWDDFLGQLLPRAATALLMENPMFLLSDILPFLGGGQEQQGGPVQPINQGGPPVPGGGPGGMMAGIGGQMMGNPQIMMQLLQTLMQQPQDPNMLGGYGSPHRGF